MALARYLPSLSRASSPSPKTATHCTYKWKAWKLRTQLFITALDTHSHTWDYRAVQKQQGSSDWLKHKCCCGRHRLSLLFLLETTESSLNSLLFSPLSDRWFFTKSWLHIRQQRKFEWVWGELKYSSPQNPVMMVLFWRLDVEITVKMYVWKKMN